jgi:hypothetical protein
VNGGVTFVRVTLEIEELMERVDEYLPPRSPFDMLRNGAHITVHIHTPTAPGQTQSSAPAQSQSHASAQDPPHLVPEDVD